MAIKYGGKTTPDYSAMRGPCSEGFHVPLTTEWQAVYDVWTALGGRDRDGTNFGIALKLPFAGYRDEDSIAYSQDTNGRYWSSSSNPSDADGSYCLRLARYIRPQEYDYRARGFSVRCFKNSPVVPTSNWTKLYGTSIEAGGIFWSSADGLISLSSDGQTWITIMDKNLGATTVWNSGDTLSEANCGKYYQWGNNYGFPRTGTVTTSATQVDASNYGPGNYYSSDTFITGSEDWSNVQNDNLRGGETGVQQRPVDLVKRYYGGKMINDIQGPAPYGFHIPTVDEWEGLYDIMSGLYLSSGEDWQENLHMPLASYRTSSGDIYQYPDMGVYWSSSPNTNSQNNAYCLDIRHNNVGPNVSTRRSYGLTVRTFSDSYIEATSSWTVINGDIGYPGIFWNQSEGLITISDGTRGYTIMDKNLGATTVYNYGDVLTDANVGYMYQWGNNYGFTSTGTISKTSSTQVDASTYGPNTDNGYYSSDTFITGSYDWSSIHNDNLWGGVTKGHHPAEVKKVYYGSTQIRPNEGGETYIIDLTESYNNTIPAGDTINKVKILLDDIDAPSALISIGSGNNSLSFVGEGMGLPGGTWVTIPTSDLSGTIEYDFNTSMVSFDLTSGGNHQSGSQQFSYWTIDESIDELISYTINQWGDPSSGTIKISIERDTSNTSTNQGQQSGGSGQGENNGGNR